MNRLVYMDNYLSILRQKVITAFKLSYSMLEVDADLLDAIYDHVGLASEEERKREMAKLLCLYIDILEHGGEPLYFSDFMLVLAPDKLGIEYIDRGEEDFKNGFSESEKSCLIECFYLFLEKMPDFSSEIRTAVEYWT